jgi:hypothetical protein
LRSVEKRVGERRRGWEKGGEEWEKGEDYPCPPLVYRRRTDNTKKKYKRTNNIFMC